MHRVRGFDHIVTTAIQHEVSLISVFVSNVNAKTDRFRLVAGEKRKFAG